MTGCPSLARVGLCLALVACEEAPRPERPPVFDRDGGDVGDALPPIDLNGRDSSRAPDGSTDASLDGAVGDGGVLPACTVRDSSSLTLATNGSAFEPVVRTTGTDAVVAWIETRGGFVDVFVRNVPALGPVGSELRLTTDTFVESGLALAHNGVNHLLAYSLTATATASDVATLTFDLPNLTILGGNDLTLDPAPDVAPRITPMLDGYFVTFARGSVADVGRTTITTTGSPIDEFEDTDPTRGFGAPFAISEASGDVRLAFRASTTTLTSIRLGPTGVVASPDDFDKTYAFSSTTLGDRIEATVASAVPRALLVTATRSARPTAFALILDEDGDLLSPIREVDTRRVEASAIATHAGRLLVVYRTVEGTTATLRLRAFEPTGTLVLDQRLQAITESSGTIAFAELGTGALLVVYDDLDAGSRRLNALRVDCGF